MNTYRIDVKVEGFSTVVVRARTLKKAEDKAWEEVMGYTVDDLRQKHVQFDNLSASEGQE